MLGLYDDDGMATLESAFDEPRSITDFISDDNSTPQPSPPSVPVYSPISRSPRTPEPNMGSSYRKLKWTPEEDDMLRQSVQIHGTKNWTAVSTLVPGRNPKQCRERWTAQLDPALTRDNWTPQEDATLLHIQKLHGNSWARIASFLPGRSSNAVKNRFNWLARRHLPQQMGAMFMQQPQHQIFQPFQLAQPVQHPWYNSLSPAQTTIGFNNQIKNVPPPRPAQSLSGSAAEHIQWDEFTHYDTSQSSMDDICGDFEWF